MEVLTDSYFVNNILKMDKDDSTQSKQLVNSWNKTVTWELVGTVYSPTECGQ